MEAFSLFQLNEYIRRVIALNFREPIWIEAEIAQVKESRGNHYLELIEKEEDGEKVIAQVSAAIWYRNFQFIKKKLGDLVYDLLEDGTQVRLKCTVDFHERYGLKLLIQDIDPNYTFGKLELKRQEIINRLEDEGLLELNKALLIPTVIQRIAVISSSGAAGYQDFLNQLNNNGYGYTFQVDLYNSAVQGAKVEEETVGAIQTIIDSKKGYHAVAIIRGGGSKLDLSGYDNFEIAKAISLSEIPFIIGIGHDIDSTVTDLVACLSLKTPTAVADYIVDRNMNFEARIEQYANQLHRSVLQFLNLSQLELNNAKDRLHASTTQHIRDETHLIHQLDEDMKNVLLRFQTQQAHLLQKLELTLDARDPRKILMQGFSYIKKNDEIIRSSKQLKKDDQVTIHLEDGSRSGKIL